MADGNDRARVARNFIARYGRSRLRWMLSAFDEGDGPNLAEIGRTLGVSRERVGQWRRTFGTTMKIYVIPEDVRGLAGMPEMT